MKLRIFSLVLMSSILCSCASTSPKKTPMLQLTNEILEAANKDYEKLYELWLQPFFKGKKSLHTGNYIDWDGWGNNRAFIDGFSRFCKATGNTIKSNMELVNQNEIMAECIDRENNVISRAKAEYWRFTLESPKTLALKRQTKEAKAERKKLFAKKIKLNGPTGWIYFNNVKYRLLRIGSLNTSHPIVLEQEVENGVNKFTYLEDYKEIRRTKSKEGYIGMAATLIDGSIIDSNIKYNELGRKGSAVHFGARNHRFVVLDNESQQPYTLTSWILPDKMVFDDPSEWKKIKNTKLKSNLSSLLVKRHNESTVIAIDKLMLKSKDEGWFSLIPNNKINERLLNSMISNLRSDSRDGCDDGQNLTFGVANLEDYAQCTAAKRELSLINKGYTISVENTPLAYYHLLKTVRNDYIG
ncbi:hypothetical protein [Colwellia psychrerythraea]|uniref:Lipoprotein n=1 Tax=Colwellia psychrerythraea TaxID=28229 RepID=A0A099KH28_COLPS|nr:hypothetical protein [Colwellia psychrerythraea]KGJ89606.1 hypothetical protein ND2E_3797 [Colwellia psychrerythraea]